MALSYLHSHGVAAAPTRGVNLSMISHHLPLRFPHAEKMCDPDSRIPYDPETLMTTHRAAAPALALFLSLCIPVPAAAARSEAPDIVRLDAAVRPTFQAVALDLDPSAKEYTGSVRVEIAVRSRQEAIRFHAQAMELRAARLRDGGRTIALRPSEGKDGLVTAVRDDGRAIDPGRYALEIEFANDFDERATSLYHLEVDGAWYAFTQFEAVDARGAFPCFDEPSFKIPYQLTITVPAGNEVVTNTPVERESTANGRRTVVFARTKPLPSYLLAIAAGPLEFTDVPGTSIPTRIVTAKGKRGLTGAVVKVTPPLLAALERYFGRRYPFEKLDLIAVPEYTYGGMENPGAITYTDQAILFDGDAMSVGQRRTLVRFIAHELAHMWFGDLVTMAWWDDLWLNESFAEWMGNKIAQEVHPELETGVSDLGETEKAYEEDARLTARAVRQPIHSVENLLSIADALTYRKGEAVLGMIERWLGPDDFRRGIRAYLKEHEWGNAVEADLWRALSRASGRDVAAVGAAFFNQPGVPLVSLEPLDGARLRISQTRFLNEGLADTVSRRWRIPVNLRYATPRGPRAWSTLLAESATVVALPGLDAAPAWIEPNADQSGYYRWALGGSGMPRLAEAAAEALTPRERLGFLLNAFALLKAGTLPGVDYLRLLTSFGDDPHPAVVEEVVSGVNAVRSYFVTDDVKPMFALYVRRVLGPAMARIGTEPKEGESASAAGLRPSLFSCLAEWGDDRRLRDVAVREADRYLRGEHVDPSMLGAVLRIAAIDGDAARFDAYRKRFEEGTVPSDRSRLLLALGSFRSPELRARALAYNLSGPLKPQEHFNILRGIGSVPEQEEEVWEWAQRHYEEVEKRMPPYYMIYYPWMASGCSEARLESARSFFADERHSPPGSAAEFKKMEASVHECIGLREREGGPVRDYLREGFASP